jgi:hypothetical protein
VGPAGAGAGDGADFLRTPSTARLCIAARMRTIGRTRGRPALGRRIRHGCFHQGGHHRCGERGRGTGGQSLEEGTLGEVRGETRGGRQGPAGAVQGRFGERSERGGGMGGRGLPRRARLGRPRGRTRARGVARGQGRRRLQQPARLEGRAGLEPIPRGLARRGDRQGRARGARREGVQHVRRRVSQGSRARGRARGRLPRRRRCGGQEAGDGGRDARRLPRRRRGPAAQRLGARELRDALDPPRDGRRPRPRLHVRDAAREGKA